MPIGPCLLARASIFVAALNLLAPLASAVQNAVEDQRIQAPASALVGTTAFGESVGVDGDRMVVGASRLSVQGAGQAGRVYVYERAPDGTWALVQEIASPTAGVSNEGFGAAVDVEGDRIVIATRTGGRAFVYEHVAGVGFELVSTLFAELGSSDFGDCIDLEGDRFVVGSISNGFSTANSGAINVFARGANGVWVREDTILGPTGVIGPPSYSSRFGSSVDLQGDAVLVGAPRQRYAGLESGAAFVCRRNSQGEWNVTDLIVSPNPAAFTEFGSAVAWKGEIAAVSARLEVGPVTTGRVHVYHAPQFGPWSLDATLVANSATDSGYGIGVDIDAERLFVAHGNSTKQMDVWQRRSNGTWLLETKVAVAPGASGFFDDQSMVADAGFVHFFGSGTGTRFIAELELGTLYRASASITASGGGTQAFTVRATDANAGRLCVVLGSLSGTAPATVLEGNNGPVVLPLVADAYTLTLIQATGAGFISPWAFVLDATGGGTSTFTLPPLVASAFAGQRLHHACLYFDAATLALEGASNAVALDLLP